jgi:peptide/nickel transport system substrate-binding protein
MSDPATFDWTEKSNQSRQIVEYLTRTGTDNITRPYLAERWEASEDLKTWTLHLRKGVKWSNGDDFNADDLMFNITRWCDATVEGNSVATRMGALVDPDTKKLREGGLERVDDHTVKMNLPSPDITLIVGMADYPSLVMHRSYDGGNDPYKALAITTGPCELVNWEPGVGAEVRRKDTPWWKGEFWLDGAKWFDHGTDPTAMIAALESDEVDVSHETKADSIPQIEAIGINTSTISTASTIVIRCNVGFPPYDDVRVRRAFQLAVDNNVVLQLGIDGRGTVAENHHVGPMHIEYADIGPAVRDVEKSKSLMADAGHTDTEFELISVDDDWNRNTVDAVGAQFRDAGIKIKRTVIPGSTFWNNWSKYPHSGTQWYPRPLGVQVYALAYKSGVPWNETAYSNAEFDSLLEKALGTPDADKRRVIMAKLEKNLRDSGVIVQPYWRALFSSYRDGVHGYLVHQSFEEHLDKVWLET